MSKIWQALREAQRLRKQRVEYEGLQNYWDAIRDIRERRSTKRFLANTPVWVYGYGATDDPFHEQTKALSVNAGERTNHHNYSCKSRPDTFTYKRSEPERGKMYSRSRSVHLLG